MTERLSDEIAIESAFSAALEFPCTCNIDDASCRHCGQWAHATGLLKRALAQSAPRPMPRGTWNPNETPEELAERMKLVNAFVASVQPGVLERAAQLLTWCAEAVRDRCKADDLEAFPYVPEMEELAEKLRALPRSVTAPGRILLIADNWKDDTSSDAGDLARKSHEQGGKDG